MKKIEKKIQILNTNTDFILFLKDYRKINDEKKRYELFKDYMKDYEFPKNKLYKVSKSSSDEE